ncbi:nicotinic acid mononucleotide adenyltransferase [Aquimarina sp. AD10]|uniref:nicotinic acid mononucleotide adenyltransferase n=1 Tax=Aquimarina sp. AD10 TaxID=1714849 RepID=UPI000E47645E|nr:nicotinic acid mononucleotide adenyltransferase [Aquimarina sp. AD10]AXT61765.1 nicotinic acid mononucleotide adenyltransferase [Aquimarina sp. AD10]RKN00884.1 nicotinic acid mononucleotide adenyltransferase [Aquimarina sp. AD10]
MKTIKLLSIIFLGAIALSACTAEVIIDDDTIIDEPRISLNALLNSYEIWYVDVERTKGNVEIPFFQKAFTVSFKNGAFYANNNLVGLGSNGNGFGLDVGYYDTNRMELEIDHDIDGFYRLVISQLSNNEIEVYNRSTNTSYYLIGYQRNSFDYDRVFYDNIHYFLQEYETWEKVYTSEFGALNAFDNENYLRFEYFGAGDNFKSSEDQNGIPIDDIYYDYTGHYDVYDIANIFDKKTLTLDYDSPDNEIFELSVINDSKIQLLHEPSGTVYHFKGLGQLQFKNAKNGSKSVQNDIKRLKKADFLKLSK